MKIRIFFALVFFWCCSVYAQSTSAQYNDSSFGTYYQQRLTFFRGMKPVSHSVVFLGDSITDGAEWSEIFGNKKMLNRGISGDVTAGVLYRLDEVVRHNPKKVFILIGTNDLARGVESEQVISNIYRIADFI